MCRLQRCSRPWSRRESTTGRPFQLRRPVSWPCSAVLYASSSFVPLGRLGPESSVDASLRCEPDRPSSNSSCHSISQHVDNFGNHSKVITSPPLHCYVRQELGLGSK